MNDAIESSPPLLGGALSAEARDTLWRHSTRERFAPKTIVFSPSLQPDAVFLLESGLIRIYRLSGAGAEVTFGFVKPGEVFGELIAFGDFSRDSFAEAVSEARVWRIGREVFESLVNSQPQLALEITRQIIGRFKRMEARVEDLILRSVRERIIRVLLELARDVGRHDGGTIRLAVPLTQARLATVVGTTRQTVNECLGELERSDLISCGSRSIHLRDPRRLAEELDKAGVSVGRQAWSERIGSLRAV